MIPQFKQYQGTFPYKTDSKNRVNVYPSWRPAQGEGISLMASVSEGVNILKVLTDEAVNYRLERIEKHATDPKEESRLKTKLKRHLRDASVNEQGKLLIPRDLAAHAGISPDSDVMLSAADSHFEIWNRAKYEEKFGTFAVPEIEDELGIF
ncbi:MAG: hypothetical protein H7Y36_04585 [Armatimonadetes bacterium]|nr:hypothetical protein [Akkermansiaceae bacterium]